MDPLIKILDRPFLEQVISRCYPANLMREEERTVRFHLIAGAPDLFSDDKGSRPTAAIGITKTAGARRTVPFQSRRNVIFISQIPAMVLFWISNPPFSKT